jgi:hypothetical protein
VCAGWEIEETAEPPSCSTLIQRILQRNNRQEMPIGNRFNIHLVKA